MAVNLHSHWVLANQKEAVSTAGEEEVKKTNHKDSKGAKN